MWLNRGRPRGKLRISVGGPSRKQEKDTLSSPFSTTRLHLLVSVLLPFNQQREMASVILPFNQQKEMVSQICLSTNQQKGNFLSCSVAPFFPLFFLVAAPLKWSSQKKSQPRNQKTNAFCGVRSSKSKVHGELVDARGHSEGDHRVQQGERVFGAVGRGMLGLNSFLIQPMGFRYETQKKFETFSRGADFATEE